MDFTGPIQGLVDPLSLGWPIAKARRLVFDPSIWQEILSAQRGACTSAPHYRGGAYDFALAAERKARNDARLDVLERIADGRLRLYGRRNTIKMPWHWIEPRVATCLNDRPPAPGPLFAARRSGVAAPVCMDGGGLTYWDIHVHDAVGVTPEIAIELYGPDDLLEMRRSLIADRALDFDQNNWQFELNAPENFKRAAAAAAEYPRVGAELCRWLDEEIVAGRLVRDDVGAIRRPIPKAPLAARTTGNASAQPTADAHRAAAPDPVPKRRPRERSGYLEKDQPLVREMHELVVSRKIAPMAAAKLVVARAESPFRIGSSTGQPS